MMSTLSLALACVVLILNIDKVLTSAVRNLLEFEGNTAEWEDIDDELIYADEDANKMHDIKNRILKTLDLTKQAWINDDTQLMKDLLPFIKCKQNMNEDKDCVDINHESHYLKQLWDSVDMGDTINVQLFIEAGMNVNQIFPDDKTMLIMAAARGYTNIVGQLLQVDGINVNIQPKTGNTALMWAAEYAHSDVVAQLLRVKGTKVNLKNMDGDTALHFAAMHGHEIVVQQLLRTGRCIVNMPNNNGETALMDAKMNGHDKIVKRLKRMHAMNNLRSK